MFPVLLELGPIKLYSYGFMIAIGILVAYSLTEKKVRKLGYSHERLDWLCLSILAGGFLGAKILYWITRLPDIPSDPSILTNLGDGWVVYGGLIGGLLAGWLYCKNHDLNFLEWLDLIVPQLALAQGFGRIGCFLAGCCYGVESSFGLIFPEESLAPAGISLFPTQLIMSAFDFGLSFFLQWFSTRKTFQGELGALHLIAYSIGRFIIEFWRGDGVRGVVNGFSTSQYIAIVMALVGLAFWFIGRKQAAAPSKH